MPSPCQQAMSTLQQNGMGPMGGMGGGAGDMGGNPFAAMVGRCKLDPGLKAPGFNP